MAPVKQVALIFAVGIAIMVGMRMVFLPDPSKPLPPPPAQPTLVAKGDWGHVDLLGFRLFLPRGFRYDRSAGQDGHVFSASPVAGFRPNVHLYWKRTKLSLAGWFDLYRSKYDGGDSVILREGNANVAGMPGKFLVYRRTVKRKGRPDLEVVTKDFYFGTRDGRCGILRGICGYPAFMKFQVIVDQVARKLTYKGG